MSSFALIRNAVARNARSAPLQSRAVGAADGGLIAASSASRGYCWAILPQSQHGGKLFSSPGLAGFAARGAACAAGSSPSSGSFGGVREARALVGGSRGFAAEAAPDGKPAKWERHGLEERVHVSPVAAAVGRCKLDRGFKAPGFKCST